MRRMSLLLLILGLVNIAAGAGMIGFGIPINEFGLGNTLISSGVTAFTGGLILIGLAATVRQLHRIVEALTMRDAPRLARPGEALEPNVPAGARPGGRISAPAQRLPAPPESLGPDLRSGDPRLATTPSGGILSDAIDRLRSNIPRP